MSNRAKYPLLLTVILTAATSMTGQAQDRPRIMPAPRADIPPSHADQVYRTSGDLELRADVYLPDSAQPTPAIAWFAGGAFRLRDKLMVRNSILDQLGRGVAIVPFEYTLADEAKWPAQAHDGKAAVRWLRSRAKDFNIDPDRIFIGGGSAGGVIANVVANSADDASLEEPGAAHADVSDHVAGVISFYTVADMTTHNDWPAENSSGAFLTGCAAEECRLVVESASPVHYVSERSPPALLFHGMGDVVVDYRQSIQLQERLNEAGVEAQLVLRSDLIHGDSRFDEPAMTDLITAFVMQER